MNDLYHHGIKGQKWGVRRFTNPDGTLTEEGKKRYRKNDEFERRLAYQSDKHREYAESIKRTTKLGAVSYGISVGTVAMLGSAYLALGNEKGKETLDRVEKKIRH